MQLNWLTDLPQAVSVTQLATILEGDGDQFYLQKLPTTDGWGNLLQFRAVFTAGTPATYQTLITSSRAIGIRSLGRKNDEGGPVYTNGTFLGTQYDGDIVWSDGYFVRVPGGLNSVNAGGGGGSS